MLYSVQWYVSIVTGYVCGYLHRRIVIIQYQGGRKEGTFPSMQNYVRNVFKLECWNKEKEQNKEKARETRNSSVDPQKKTSNLQILCVEQRFYGRGLLRCHWSNQVKLLCRKLSISVSTNETKGSWQNFDPITKTYQGEWHMIGNIKWLKNYLRNATQPFPWFWLKINKVRQ